MAIPFFEPRNTENAPAGDQVDGHVPHVHTAMPPAAATTEASAPPAVEELPWKVLALAMCKVLKDYYQQTAANPGAPTFSTAVIQILPSGQPQPQPK